MQFGDTSFDEQIDRFERARISFKIISRLRKKYLEGDNNGMSLGFYANCGRSLFHGLHRIFNLMDSALG